MAIIVNSLVIKGLTVKMVEKGFELVTSAKMVKLLLIYQCKVSLKICLCFNNKGMLASHYTVTMNRCRTQLAQLTLYGGQLL